MIFFGLRAWWLQLTKKQLILCGCLGVACTAAIAIGLGVGIPQANSSNSKVQASPSRSDSFEGNSRSGSVNEIYNYETVLPPSPTELGEYDTAAVSADGQPCAQIATEVLRKNGSAADATIAGLFCVGVINTQSMGLGGGFLLTYYERATGKAYTLIARESAAAESSENMYNGNEDPMLNAKGKWWANKRPSLKGGLAVAVPGELRGYKKLYDKFGGKIPWADLIEPTIKLCEDGHKVNWHMARALKSTEDSIKNEPSMSVFINPDTGNVYEEGDILKRPQLAKTLRVIQDDPDALYTGQLADQLIQDIQSFDGIITTQDLRDYNAQWKDATNVSIHHGNLTLYSVPPPGSGLILSYILNILDEYDITPESMNEENAITTHQRITEAMKYAYAMRTELGDADYVDMTKLTYNLTSDALAKSIRNQILDNQTFQDPAHYGAVTAVNDDHGTAQFSLLAPNGDAVSVTSTINLYFGAGIRSVQTGIVLNDEMDDFSAPNITNYFGIPPSPSNFIKPGKRPVSSMCPSVLVDSNGDVRLVLGAAGGSKIPSAVAWVSLRNLWLNETIKEAVDARRIHHQLFPMIFSYENGTSSEIVTGMHTIGHETQMFGIGGSVVCAISRERNGKIYANSDFRKAGEVDGF